MRRRLLVSTLALWAGGCTVGEGTGSVTGSIWLNQCTNDNGLGSQGAPAAFDLHASYFVAQPIQDLEHPGMMNRLAIKIQAAGTLIEESDGLYINIADVAPVATMVAQPIPVGPATNVRATLNLWRTCPQISVQLECDGTITFTRFGTPGGGPDTTFRIQNEDPLTATFSFDLVDRRALTLGGVGPVTPFPDAGGHIDGNFDFIVRQGRAAQPF
jgi:hypothetical protein